MTQPSKKAYSRKETFMALTVNNLYKESAKYKIKLHAGEGGLTNLVSWIHIVETVEGAGFLHGNEIVVTEGAICRSDDELMAYVKEVHAHNASAVILNTGKFIVNVPSNVIDFCNDNNLPLFSVPWEVPLVDLTADYCKRIVDHISRQDSIATTLKNLIFHTGDKHELIHQMERFGYLKDSSMAFVCISLEWEKTSSEFVEESRKIKKIAEQSAKRINDKYISFEYQDKRIVALINYSAEEIEKYTDMVFKAISANKRVPYIYIGISDNIKGFETQDNNFMRAYAACRIAIKKNEHVLTYQELGIYKLLVNVKNNELLLEMYQSIMGKLLDYDKDNGTEYCTFIDKYIECDGSTRRVSEELFIHRNTVNNYLNRIEEILDMDITSWENKAILFTAHCISTIL